MAMLNSYVWTLLPRTFSWALSLRAFHFWIEWTTKLENHMPIWIYSNDSTEMIRARKAFHLNLFISMVIADKNYSYELLAFSKLLLWKKRIWNITFWLTRSVAVFIMKMAFMLKCFYKWAFNAKITCKAITNFKEKNMKNNSYQCACIYIFVYSQDNNYVVVPYTNSKYISIFHYELRL